MGSAILLTRTELSIIGNRPGGCGRKSALPLEQRIGDPAMMRSVPGDTQPCELCRRPTRFTFELRGPHGAHIRWARVCSECGEHPGKTALLAPRREELKSAA